MQLARQVFDTWNVKGKKYYSLIAAVPPSARNTEPPRQSPKPRRLTYTGGEMQKPGAAPLLDQKRPENEACATGGPRTFRFTYRERPAYIRRASVRATRAAAGLALIQQPRCSRCLSASRWGAA